jgi:hypothetical protein
MLNFLLDHSPALVIAELLFALAIVTFATALVGAVREKYSVRVPLERIRDRINR